MYTIGLDSSHKFLLVVLIKDDEIIDSVKLECFKQQSEYIIPKMDELLKNQHLTIDDIDNIVITKGPGSYTGVRIAMTVAKVIGSLKEKNVYTLSTLQLYAGLKNCYVLLDARAKRVYCGHYNNGQAVDADTIYTVEKMKEIMDSENCEFIGDLHLFDKEDSYPDVVENFLSLKPYWEKVENIDILTPEYLKSNQEYMK